MKLFYIILMVATLAVVASPAAVDAKYLGELPPTVNPIGLEDGQYSVEHDGISAEVTLLGISEDEMIMRVTSNPEAPAFKFTQTDGSEIPAILMFQMGDTNENGYLDIQDFVVLSHVYGSEKGSNRYKWIVDFDLDGKVGFADYMAFVTEYNGR
jgi:hypothetical protein